MMTCSVLRFQMLLQIEILRGGKYVHLMQNLIYFDFEVGSVLAPSDPPECDTTNTNTNTNGLPLWM